jgi:hypothetical protein
MLAYPAFLAQFIRIAMPGTAQATAGLPPHSWAKVASKANMLQQVEAQ